MATDLFRITMSRDVDRNRYMAALLSAGRPALKADVPKCLRPASRQAEQRNREVLVSHSSPPRTDS